MPIEKERAEMNKRYSFDHARFVEYHGKHCPCMAVKIKETICPCLSFRKKGVCICGLFKEEESSSDILIELIKNAKRAKETGVYKNDKP